MTAAAPEPQPSPRVSAVPRHGPLQRALHDADGASLHRRGFATAEAARRLPCLRENKGPGRAARRRARMISNGRFKRSHGRRLIIGQFRPIDKN